MPGIRRAFLRSMRPLAAVLAVLVAPSASSAATLEKLSVEELIAKSTAIVRGRVTGASASYRGSVIYTALQIQVGEPIKGTAAGTLQVLVPGGTVAGVRQSVSGAPALAPGKDYLLFLWTARSGASFITGLTQGVFELTRNSAGQLIAVRAASSETVLAPRTLQVVRDEPLWLPLDEIKARVAAQGAGN